MAWGGVPHCLMSIAPPDTASRAILLVAHGSRYPAWVAPFERIRANLVKALGVDRVALAFLEYTQPDPDTAVKALLELGARDVALLPMFLGTGMHARKDMHAVWESLSQTHPQARFSLHPSLGETPSVLDAIVATAVGVVQVP
jgi:sirohydrochlorin cobaltochelatase